MLTTQRIARWTAAEQTRAPAHSRRELVV